MRGVERCYDIYESEFTPPPAQEAAVDEGAAEVSAHGYWTLWVP